LNDIVAAPGVEDLAPVVSAYEVVAVACGDAVVGFRAR
jgi:hypothetical protein